MRSTTQSHGPLEAMARFCVRTTADVAGIYVAFRPEEQNQTFAEFRLLSSQTAVVMSSGKGDLSRLYKTRDACRSWRLVFTNPDREGSWAAIQFAKRSSIRIKFASLHGMRGMRTVVPVWLPRRASREDSVAPSRMRQCTRPGLLLAPTGPIFRPTTVGVGVHLCPVRRMVMSEAPTATGMRFRFPMLSVRMEGSASFVQMYLIGDRSSS
jgi:hypothetical protein